QAVQLIGMPEGRIPLAQAVVHLATAPKSNASYVAIDAALADVKSGHAGTVPKPLRDAQYPGAKALGHGVGYKYPHAYPHAITDQQYLPDELQGREYYQPTGNGREQMLAERVDRLRAVIRNQPMPQSQPTPEADAQGPEQQELGSVRNNVADD